MAERKTLVPPGTYYTAVAAHYDGSGILGVYGLSATEQAAEAHGAALREAGVHPHENWTVTPLLVVDLGPPPALDDFR